MTRAQSWRGPWKAGVAAVVLALVMAPTVGGIWYLMQYLYRAAECDAASAPLKTRDVYILIDRTRSQGPDRREGSELYLQHAKMAVVDGLLPRFGAGDRVFAFYIGTGFGLIDNRVFDSTADQSLAARAMDRVARAGLPDCPASRNGERLCKIWKQSSSVWGEQVKKIDLQGEGGKDPLGASSYLDALEQVGQALASATSDEKWVVIVGDLLEHPLPKPFLPPEPVDDKEAQAFASVRVALVFPWKSDRGKAPTGNKPGAKDPDSRERLKFWNAYFAKRGHFGEVMHLFYDSPDLRDPQRLMPVNPLCISETRE